MQRLDIGAGFRIKTTVDVHLKTNRRPKSVLLIPSALVLALMLTTRRDYSVKHELGAEPSAPPNGGPATPVGDSEVTEGPSSVSRSSGRARMIHNRYLPSWLHRVCNGLFGAAVLIGVSSFWFGAPEGTWRHVLSRCLIWSSIPAGIILALVVPRCSIVEGVAGGDGYDEMDAPGAADKERE